MKHITKITVLILLCVGTATLRGGGTEISSSKDKNVTQAAAALGCNFSGFYLGGNAGASWMHYDFEALRFTVGQSINEAYTFTDSDRATTDNMEFVGGGQVGYQWQFGRWVFGIEADGQLLGDANGDVRFREVADEGVIVTRAHSYANTDWMASGRLRLGYTFDCLMLYVTGGVAVEQTDVQTDIRATYFFGKGGFVEARRSSDENTTVGYTVGAGLDWQLVRWARLGIEYRFSAFNDSFDFEGSPPRISIGFNGGSRDVDVQNHQVTVRVNIPFSTFFGSGY